MRWYRDGDMDLRPAEPPPFRSDALREHVDELPPLQKHIIERLYFGGADLLSVAAECGVSPKHCREQRARALETLKGKVLSDHMQEGDEVGTLSPA